MSLPPPISPRRDGTGLRVRVVPNAGRAGVVGLHGDALKVRVCSPPVDGRANEEVCEVVAAALGVHARDVSVASGHTSKSKMLEIASPPDEVASRLSAWLA